MWKPITLLCILLLPCVSCTLTRDGESYDKEEEEETKNLNHLKKLLNQVSQNLHSAKEADKRNEQRRRPKDWGDRKSTDLNNEVSPYGKSSSSSDQRKTESWNDNPKSSRGKIQPYKGKQDKTKSSGGKPRLTKIIHLLAKPNKMVSKSSKTKSKPHIGKSNSAHVKVKPLNGKQGKTGSSSFIKTLTGDQNQQSRGQTTVVKEVNSDNTKSSRVTQSSTLRPLINQLKGKMLSDKTRQRKVAIQVQGKNKPSDDKSDSSRSVNANRPSSKQGTVRDSDRSRLKSSDTKSSGRSSDTNQGYRKSTDLNNEVSPYGKSSSSSDQRKTESSNDNPKSSRWKIQPYKGKQDKTKSSGGKPRLTKIIHLLAKPNKMVSKSSKTKSKPCICKSNSAHVKVKPLNGKQGKTGSSSFIKTLTGDQNQQSRGQTTVVKEVDSDNTKSSRVTQSSPLRPLINQLKGIMLSDKTRQRKVAKQVKGKNKPSDDKSDSSRSVNPNRPSSKQGTVRDSDRSRLKSSDTKSSGRSSDTNQDHVKKHNQYDQYYSGHDDLRSRRDK